MRKQVQVIIQVTSVMLIVFLLISCKTDYVSKEEYEIEKSIDLTMGNKAFNDTLHKFNQEFGVDFMLCYIISKGNHRRLGFQIMQSDAYDAPPINIENPFKIENIQGIDIYFCTAKNDSTDNTLVIDGKTQKLIDKGYLTTNGKGFCYISKSVDLIFCRDNDNVFKILSSDFLVKEETKALKAGRPFVEEYYYPNCN